MKQCDFLVVHHERWAPDDQTLAQKLQELVDDDGYTIVSVTVVKAEQFKTSWSHYHIVAVIVCCKHEPFL